MEASIVRAGAASTSFALPAVPPMHLEATVRALQRRPSNRVDRWDGRRYLRALPTPDGLRLVAVENRGTITAPALHGQVYGGPVSPAGREQIGAAVTRLLGLAVDLAPFYARADEDPRLRTVVAALRGLKPPRFATLFETLANVIPFQQVSIASGVAVVARLVERFGPRLELGEQTYFAFPGPDEVAAASVEELHRLGLSQAKARTLHALAAQVQAGELSEEGLAALSSAEAMAALTARPGIGPWSAGLILLRGLGRLEVFPRGDVGAVKNVGRLLDLEGPVREDEIGPVVAGLGPVQGCLYFYALGWRLLHEGLIAPAPPV